jgi:hypothetical protein
MQDLIASQASDFAQAPTHSVADAARAAVMRCGAVGFTEDSSHNRTLGRERKHEAA